MLIGQRLATLHELETVYSYEDALNMAEVVVVDKLNEYRAIKSAQRR